MIPAHTKQLELLDVQIKAAHEGVEDDRLKVCVIAHTGIGDRMRALAFCQAVKRVYLGCHIFFPWRFDLWPVAGLDIAHNAQLMRMIDAHAPMNTVPRRMFIPWLRERFDVVFDVTGVAVAAYWDIGGVPLAIGAEDPFATHWAFQHRQKRADMALRPFLDIYSGHPWDNWRLIYEPYSQWEIMAASSGIPVDPLDLIPPLECAPIDDEMFQLSWIDGSVQSTKDAGKFVRERAGCSLWEKSRVRDCKYVVVHNSVGGGQRMKEAPPEVFAAIVKRLKDDGIKCVQVGGKDDARMEGTVDRRGHRLPMVAKLIGESVGVVAVEGLLPYIARSMNKMCMVLFGATPVETYSIDGFVNLVHRNSIGAPACPIKSCFAGGGGYTLHEHWDKTCCLSGHPMVNNREVRHCLNMPFAEEAAENAAAMVKRIQADTKGQAA